MSKPAPIALFGGSFDPVHHAHVALVTELQDRFDFGQFRIMPCGQHALGKQFSVDDSNRLAMLQAAFETFENVCLDLYEVRSPKPSYAVDSCKRHQATANGAALFFVVGSDILGEFHRWDRWREILDWANLLIIRRPSERQASVDSDVSVNTHGLPSIPCPDSALGGLASAEGGYIGSNDLLRDLLDSEGANKEVSAVLLDANQSTQSHSLAQLDSSGAVVCIELSQWTLSSSTVRALLAKYDDQSAANSIGHIDGWLQRALPAKVWSYIKAKKLYRAT